MLWTLTFLLVFSLLSVVVFARPEAKVCCANPSSCVVWDSCFAPNAYHATVDGDTDQDYCEGGGNSGKWWDCWSDGQSGCDTVDVHGIPVAAYCDGATHDCVAKKSNCASCGGDYECKGGSCTGGLCRTTTNEAGLCSNGLDDDCDGLTDCNGAGDPDCGCCGTLGNPCCTSGTECTQGYCSKVNPTYGTAVDPHCCPSRYWWDIDDCVGYQECNPECVANPFNDACVSPNDLFGCCPFYGGGLTYQEITTY